MFCHGDSSYALGSCSFSASSVGSITSENSVVFGKGSGVLNSRGESIDISNDYEFDTRSKISIITDEATDEYPASSPSSGESALDLIGDCFRLSFHESAGVNQFVAGENQYVRGTHPFL